MFLDKKMNEDRGVFEVFNHTSTAELIYYGLYTLQHCGQESAGIVAVENGNFNICKSEGLVRNIFTQTTIKRLIDNNRIGCVRYSTTGESNLKNVQSFLLQT